MISDFHQELTIKLATLFILSVLPSLTYLIIVQKFNRRWRSRLRRVRTINSRREIYYENSRQRVSKRHIGDASCQYNALSRYVRCAIAPYGPCKGCSHYREREIASKFDD